MANFQYQALAEPVTSSSSPPVVSLDQWYQQPAGAPQRGGTVAVRGDGLPVLDTTGGAETVLLDKWLADQNDPSFFTRYGAKLPTRLGDSSHATTLGLFATETVGLDKWYGEDIWPEKNRSRWPTWLEDYTTTLGLFTAETVGLDKWLVDPNEPLRHRTQLPTGLGDFTTIPLGLFPADTVGGPDTWLTNPSTPTRQRTQLPTWLEGYGTTWGVFTLETTTQPDKWLPGPNQPVRPLPRLPERDAGYQNFQENFVTLLNPATGFPWPLPVAPPRVRRRELEGHSDSVTAGLGVVLSETITLDRWYTEDNGPEKKRHRCWWFTTNPPPGFFTAETVGLDKWSTEELGLPPARPRRSGLPYPQVVLLVSAGRLPYHLFFSLTTLGQGVG